MSRIPTYKPAAAHAYNPFQKSLESLKFSRTKMSYNRIECKLVSDLVTVIVEQQLQIEESGVDRGDFIHVHDTNRAR